MATLQFESFHSFVDATFWYELERRKLNLWRLDNSIKPIVGEFATGGEHLGLSSRFHLSRDSFVDEGTNKSHTPFTFTAPGQLLNCNTIEEFKNLDRPQLLREQARHILDAIRSGAFLSDPSILTRFLLISFADLKSHRFYFWFAHPALIPSKTRYPQASPAVPITDLFSPIQIDSLRTSFDHFRAAHPVHLTSFFFVSMKSESDVEIHPLREWKSLREANPQGKLVLGFADPCALKENPGWPLRNLLVAAAHHFGESDFTVLCLREMPSRAADISHSLIIRIQLAHEDFAQLPDDILDNSVGWEKNKDGKNLPRYVDLGAMMDPIKLAESSVSLNLQLMKWRMFPSLDTDVLSSTKCLLIGAGTLGCHVARNLLAWGIHHVTFVDRGHVSFSNPVRQPLFEFEDCLNGGKDKALAAADHLRKIFPSVVTEAHTISIPMPGHVVASDKEKRQTIEDITRLRNLIESHDVLFLLTDSRESRWLPTVLGTHLHKIIIDAALGFDSYLVMRHGMLGASQGGKRLGCYFCNDVVAPSDSLTDRTLDQQCTVTRPGVSAMAGALSVELLASILHHPLRASAPADSAQSVVQENSLGIVPHQLRGFVTNFQQLLLTGYAYTQCTACSEKIMQEYERRGDEFLIDAINRPDMLEELTGLKELHKQTEDAIRDWEDVDDEEAADDDDF